jgi:DNA-binding LacI/PurR family transcriptional regulator
MPSRVTPQQVIRLAAEAGLSIDTVKKYLRREGRVTSTTEDRMKRALEALKIQAPDATEPAAREEPIR